MKQAALGDSAEALLTLTPVRRSGQRLDFAYSESGSVAALQVVEYQGYRPVPIMATSVLTGASAKAFVDVIKKLEEQQHELNDDEEDESDKGRSRGLGGGVGRLCDFALSRDFRRA